MIDCDFLPADYHNRQDERRTLRRRAACLGVMVGLMGIWLGQNRREIAQADWFLGDLAAQQQQLKISLARKEQLIQERERLKAQQEIVEKLQEHVSLVVLFADLSARIPESVALTSVSLAVPPPPPTLEGPSDPKKPPAGEATAGTDGKQPAKSRAAGRLRLTMRGAARTARDVSEFLAELELSPLVDHVQMDLKGPSAWAGRQVQAFVLSCDLKPQQGARQ